jgi:protein-S-isoprenylcysteine O-methyltransferase Ste14
LPPSWLLAALIAVGLMRLVSATPLLTPAWTAAGIVPLLCGLWLNIAGDRRFRAEHTPMSPWTEPSTLVTTGLFGRTRNPMYLGMVLIVMGAAVIANRPAAMAVPFALAAVLHTRFITVEESALAARFGERYGRYRARVRRWL